MPPLWHKVTEGHPVNWYTPSGTFIFIPRSTLEGKQVKRVRYQQFYDHWDLLLHHFSTQDTAGVPLHFSGAFSIGLDDTLAGKLRAQVRIPLESPEKELALYFDTPSGWLKVQDQVFRVAAPESDPDFIPPAEGAAKEGVIAPWQESGEKTYWQPVSRPFVVNISRAGTYALALPYADKLEKYPVNQASKGNLFVYFRQAQHSFLVSPTDSSRYIFLPKHHKQSFKVFHFLRDSLQTGTALPRTDSLLIRLTPGRSGIRTKEELLRLIR